ncbi:MAG TPA: N-6 DNA methylase [Candidatus Methanoperedens sp.]|nr:N-6 DNA methylase [Candidatus Methanoperedens sp.]
MLDQETKRKIDNARDILVGKVPDPKSQVEQITIALIYKFMDDMDKESQELGGKAAFFKGEFEKYTWSRIFDPKLGGFDLITLYSEAITTMNHNENIPQLFRDIFKNAFLPYRDPETLKSFLKEINEFKYDHSEKLGDAFEYLLSVLGSQGDAGQFRTPRHIIDFIVSVVDPKKNESILDPACGTAGFLISSFKHILHENTKERKGDCLTMDERKRLMNSLVGYDISPDMVRLSLVNMYLHGFQTPKIHEYDTLTSEEKWNETYDVILANPPFMTPKGGIRPHKRFSVQANRSEVLFVDYIMEHISTNGRAGVIVPEGIIFQSANAYKALRKLLVDTHLFAVVSLPSGVFQPYAGVKTSILLMDRTLAKRAPDILFVKLESDGFDLGAQRRPNGKSDLPAALSALLKFRKSLHEGKECEFSKEEERLAHRVAKRRIAEGGDYNLSGERYKEVVMRANGGWEMVELGDVCKIISDGTHETPSYETEGIVFLSSKNVTTKKIDWDNVKYISRQLHEKLSKRISPRKDDILLAKNGTTGVAAIVDKDVVFDIYVSLALLRPSLKLNPRYLLEIINCEMVKKQFNSRLKGIGVPNLHLGEIKEVKIPLPLLSVQQEIVAEIEGYQKVIDGARQVVENYKPKIKVDEGWEVVELGDIVEINPSKSELKGLDKNLDVSFLPMSDLQQKQISFEIKEKRKLSEVIKGYTYFKNNDVLLAKITPCFENGKSGIAKDLVNGIGFGSTEFIVFRPISNIIPEWIYYHISENGFLYSGKNNMTGSAGQQRLSVDFIKHFKIPLPPLDIQKEIVTRIEEEQELVEANKKLIELFEGKIKAKIAEVWS